MPRLHGRLRVVTFKLSEKVLEELDRRARAMGKNRSDVIRLLIENFLNNGNGVKLQASGGAFACPFCRERYSGWGALISHIHSCHDLSVCPCCGGRVHRNNICEHALRKIMINGIDLCHLVLFGITSTNRSRSTYVEHVRKLRRIAKAVAMGVTMAGITWDELASTAKLELGKEVEINVEEEEESSSRRPFSSSR